MTQKLEKFLALFVLCCLFALILGSAASCGPPDSGAGNALEFDGLDEDLALEGHVLQDSSIPCYEKHICAYKCPFGSNIIFFDLDNEKNSDERQWLLKSYKSECQSNMQASVDSIVSKAINQFIVTISFQLKNPLYYKNGKFVVPHVEEMEISSSRNEQLEQGLFQFMTKISTTRASGNEEKAIRNLDIPALLKGDTQALSGLKSLLLEFVSDSNVVHLCSKAQIKGGNYIPSQTLLSVWDTYFKENAQNFLSSSDYDGLNITALGQTVIMETVSAYSAPCYCSELFPANSNIIYKAGLEIQASNSCPSELPLFLSKSFFVKLFEVLVDFLKDIAKLFVNGWDDFLKGWNDIVKGWNDIVNDVENFVHWF